MNSALVDRYYSSDDEHGGDSPESGAAEILKQALEGHLDQLQGEGGEGYLEENWQRIYRDVVNADDLGELYDLKFRTIDQVQELWDSGSDVADFLADRRMALVLDALRSAELPPRSDRGNQALADRAVALGGRFTWIHGGKMDFTRWLLDDDAIDEASARFNCFEAVLYAAVTGSVIDRERVAAIYRRYGGSEGNSLGDALSILFGEATPLYDLVEQGHLPAPGDVLVFRDVETHVALSLGGNAVISLWDRPNDTSTYQQTTITALVDASGLSALDIMVMSGGFTPV
ncbi:hypothetical protein [Sorangium sp. So ce117]|uniref:hypothetical protein n=1 Tax=Sorangium sp. So ce117 TaxID=3133277 RepID=UPI003F5E8389